MAGPPLIDTTSIMKQTDQIGDLASIAAQYGPFLFAILFILFVPYLGQKWFSAILQARIAGNAQERAAHVQVYRFYWVSGIIMGLALTVLSVSWWLYVQMRLTLPSYENQIENRVSAEISKRIFEGVIRGTNDDDMFISDNANSTYRIYLFPLRNQVPMIVHFAVIFTQTPQPNSLIHVEYMDKKTYDSLKDKGIGALPIPLVFCPIRDATDLLLVKSDASTTQPHFNIDLQNCGGQRP